MDSKKNTRDHNKELLQNCDYYQINNTTVFKRIDDNGRPRMLLSPAVSESATGVYWFDIRAANLNRIAEFGDTEPRLLVRIVPDLFFPADWQSIQPLISSELMGNRTHSGNVWGIHIDMSRPASGNEAVLHNVGNQNIRYADVLLGKNEATSWLKDDWRVQ